MKISIFLVELGVLLLLLLVLAGADFPPRHLPLAVVDLIGLGRPLLLFILLRGLVLLDNLQEAVE